jgi:hypothetical protein
MLDRHKYIRTTEGSFKGTLGKLPIGINKKESFIAQEIKN